MRKPISVQFKFFEDLNMLTDPTEPRICTIEIPAQDHKKFSRYVKRCQPSLFVTLCMTAALLALCGCLFLAALSPHPSWP